MGLTVGAISTTSPDAFMSFLCARAGHGDMSVSNAIGSNIFDVLIALGLPWLVYSAIYGGAPYQAEMTDVLGVGIALSILVVVFIVYLAVTSLRLHAAFGYSMLASYVAFVIYAFLVRQCCFVIREMGSSIIHPTFPIMNSLLPCTIL